MGNDHMDTIDSWLVCSYTDLEFFVSIYHITHKKCSLTFRRVSELTTHGLWMVTVGNGSRRSTAAGAWLAGRWYENFLGCKERAVYKFSSHEP